MEKRNYTVRKPAPRPSQADMVFGTQSVLETLRSGKEIERLFIQRELGLTEIEKTSQGAWHSFSARSGRKTEPGYPKKPPGCYRFCIAYSVYAVA